MSFCSLIEQSNLLTNGCKRYYKYLFNLQKMSIKQNWIILDGKYKNNNFVIAKDSHATKKLLISRSSLANYKKTLKALGLISVLPKFTTKTNICKNNHFCQITVLNKTPRQFISKLLVFKKDFKSLKATSNIISRFGKKLKVINGNLHIKVNKIIFNLKRSNPSNNQHYTNFDDSKYLDVTNILNKYNIKFKSRDLDLYLDMYNESMSRFLDVAKYCNDKFLLSPIKYFTKVFNNYVPLDSLHKNKCSPKNNFCNFPQRAHDFEKLEKLLIDNYNKGVD